MLRYLSLDWIAALGDEVGRSDALKEAAAGRHFGVTQIVTDGPEGDVCYHLAVDDGTVRFAPGRPTTSSSGSCRTGRRPWPWPPAS